LLNGCDGETRNQIREMLGYEDLSINDINQAYNSLVSQLLATDEEVTLALANAIWYRDNFDVKEGFLQTMDSAFDATIGGLYFASPAALETINQWADDNTNGKIPQVLSQISPDAVMFLMNALYFKGMWTDQFDSAETYDEAFHFSDGTSENVPFMHGEISSKMMETINYKALELNYGRRNFSMIVIVPDDELDGFIQFFDQDIWNEITGTLGNQPEQDIAVSMPKFSFEYEKQLKDQLQLLGMVDAFDSILADLSGISDAVLFVSFVKQNTFIEVNEEGTEAAAVTTVGVNELTALPDEPLEFIIDKPFVFAIREQTTNTLMFIGKVVQP
jgi:serpin B